MEIFKIKSLRKRALTEKKNMKILNTIIVQSGYDFTPYLVVTKTGNHQPFPNATCYSLCQTPSDDWEIKKFKSLGKKYSLFKMTMWPHTEIKRKMRTYGYKFRPGGICKTVTD